MPGACAPAIGRLTKRADFVAAASGRRFHTERMTVQGRPRPDRTEGEPRLRIGFTLTKRVGHATERNRMRRRLKSAALDAAAPHADMAADVVVIARRETLSADYRLLVEDLARALKIVTKPKPRPSGPPPSTGDEPRGRIHV